ncbi:MAG TPA: hypothetical protein VGI58_14680 [Streptosporangiaceae bacterium]|jgi:hypothetical protein
MSNEADPATGHSASIASIVAAASGAIGRPLTEPAELAGGHADTAVLRCADAAAGSGHTVVVKAFPPTGEGASGFAAEAAGLQCATGTGLSPEFLGADASALVIVMSDLGGGASLADALLADCGERHASPGATRKSAEAVLVDWAAACGRLSAVVTPLQSRFAALQASYLAGRPDERHSVTLPQRVLAAAANAARVGVAAPADLAAELEEIAGAAVSDEYAVFSPGDLCPDNNVLTTAGVAFFDFEEAGFGSVFLDAAYIRMPFSTCWCVFRFPPALLAAAEHAYRDHVRLVWPELADDRVWERGMRRAVTAWTLSSTSWLLRRALAADVPMEPARPSPLTRQLMRYRWQATLTDLTGAGEYPAIAALLHALLGATRHWQAPELPLYPALRTGRAERAGRAGRAAE